MSRYLLTAWPLVGHIHPFVSIARALQERGHDVAFYTGERAGPRWDSSAGPSAPHPHGTWHWSAPERRFRRDSSDSPSRSTGSSSAPLDRSARTSKQIEHTETRC